MLIRLRVIIVKSITIDIVSDVVCPWCAVGYAHLKQALAELDNTLAADIHWRAFELNPHMGGEGQDIQEHLIEKYGSTPEQLDENKQRLVEIGKAAGVDFNFGERSRIYNTFDCHKLLHWVAGLASENEKASDEKASIQTQLKQALFEAYFTQGKDISDREVLLSIVDQMGLDVKQAQEILDSDAITQAIRDEQKQYQSMGISAVPAFIINNQYLISGGQPVDVFKQALTEISSKSS